MPLDYNPIGFHVLESQNPDADLAFWRQLKPHSMTFTQRVFGMIKEAHDTIPELRVICLRTVLDNEGEKTLYLHADYREMVRAFKEFVDVHHLDYNRVYLSLWCEPDLRGSERKAILRWTVDAMRYAWTQGVRCAVLGVGMATLESWHWLSGDFNELMLELSTGWHVLRIHGYYGPVAYAGAAGVYADTYLSAELAQEKYAPSPYDVQEGSKEGDWFVGRIFTGIVPLCKKLNLPLPRIIQDEGGPDRMQNLEWVELATGEWVNIYGNLESDPPVGYARDEMINGDIKHLKVPWPHWGMRGWNTLRWVWNAYYPDMEPGDVLARMTSWEIWVHTLYTGGHLFIEAFQLFAWCPGHTEWDIQHGFDMSKDGALHQALQDYSDAIYAQQPPGPDPEPPPNPEPQPDPDPPPDEPVPVWVGVVIGTVIWALLLALVIGGIFFLSHLKTTGAQSAGGKLMDQNLIDIWNGLSAIPIFAAIGFGVPTIYYLIEIWKRYLDPRIPTPTQKWLAFIMKPTPVGLFVFLVFVMAGSYYAAGTYGQEDAFKTVVEWVNTFFDAFGRLLLPVVVVQTVGSRWYDRNRAAGAAGFNAKSVTRK